MMDYGQALALVGGLSKPSKMPWWSWSISASDCITGGKLREVEGSTCSNCYALKGRYMFPNVKEAHVRRREALDHPDFVPAFVTVLNRLVENSRKGENRFRWFDAGDLPDLAALEKINQIAGLTPGVRHWLPTREFKIVREFLARYGAFAPNLTVRLSAPMVGQKVSPFAGTTWSGVDVEGIRTCPAPQQNNQCRACDTCWTRDPVSYHLH